jgi:integrase
MAYATRQNNCPFVVSWKGAGISEVKTAWNKARERAKVPSLLVHDLRRTAVRNMIRAGIPEKQAMRISGHKSRSIFDRYDITDERDIQHAGQKLARYLEEKGKMAKEVASVEITGESSEDRKPESFH